jgi:hypothetical protein
MLMEGEWREVRDRTSWTPERFTSAVYQQVMAGKPRMAGARAALEHFGVPDVDARAERYAATKQQYVVKLIEEGRFMAFPRLAGDHLEANRSAGAVQAAERGDGALAGLQGPAAGGGEQVVGVVSWTGCYTDRSSSTSTGSPTGCAPTGPEPRACAPQPSSRR